MHNKQSNLFCIGAPTHVRSQVSFAGMKIQAPIIWQDTELPNAVVLKWRYIFRLAGNVGISDHLGKTKPFSSDFLVTENQKKHSKCCNFFYLSQRIKD